MKSRHFHDILELKSYLHEHDERSLISQIRTKLYPGWHIWVGVLGNSGSRGRIVPIDLGSFLYRGQTQVYEPCYPSIFRKAISRERLIMSCLRMAEFRLLCLSHPGVQKCLDFGIDIEFTGLAQHYGFETNYLDFTQSMDIAAFFATCLPNDEGLFQPYEGEGVGIIYRVRYQRIAPYTRPILIGRQPFPRPEKQKAWSLALNQQINFSTLPGVEAFTFNHIPDGSKKIFELFNRGEDLFSPDPIEIKAQAIKELNTFSRKALKSLIECECFKNIGDIKRQYISSVIRRNPVISISDEPPVTFSSSELEKLASYWAKNGRFFLKKVGAVYCCNGINR